MKQEIWVSLKMFYGYEVSSFGNVRSIDKVVKCNTGKMKKTGRVLKPNKAKNGYLICGISINGKLKLIKIHRLVGVAFLGLDYNNKQLQINHIDRNKENNNVNNLEVVSCRLNVHKYLKQISDNKTTIGVTKHPTCNRWLSKFTIGRKQIYNGLYKTEIEATKAHIESLKKYGIII